MLAPQTHTHAPDTAEDAPLEISPPQFADAPYIDVRRCDADFFTGRGATSAVIDEAAEALGDSVPADASETWRGSGTVLVADDEAFVLNLAEQMLGRIGFDTIAAPHGREAIELFITHHEELTGVVLDLTMPHLNGEEVFEVMREIRHDIPIFISSGCAKEEMMQRFAGKSVAGFLKKPYDLKTLRKKMKEVLGK